METRRSKRKQKEQPSSPSAAARDTRSKRTRRSARSACGKEPATAKEAAEVGKASTAAPPAVAGGTQAVEAGNPSGARQSRRSRQAEANPSNEAGTVAAGGQARSVGKRDSQAAVGGSHKDDKEQQPGNTMDRNRPRNDSDDNGSDEQPDDFGPELFGRNFSSASSALQGLLRKLGAGMDDCGVPGGAGANSRVKSILTALRQDGDEVQQLEALGQLCELLSISTEESLTVFPVESVVPLLVNHLNVGTSPDVMLLAARALTFLADVLPSSCSSIVRHGGVPAFCTRLLTIEYIDLAEQSLQALEKLSNEHPGACLRNGALLAVLSYIDFFQTGVQRVAVATAANMCRGLSVEHAASVRDAVPILTNLLQYQDSKVVDNACLALMRIAESFSGQPSQLELLVDSGVVASALQLIGVSESGSMTTQLSPGTYYGLVKLLATAASGCPAATRLLLQSGVSRTLRSLLASSSFTGGAGGAGGAAGAGGAGGGGGGGGPASLLSSSEQLYEVLCLVAALLPPVPDAARAVAVLASGAGLPGAVPAPALPPPAPSSLAQPPPQQAQREAEADAARFLAVSPDLLERFAADLLPLLLQLHGGTVIPHVRAKCLASVGRVCYHAPPDLLKRVLQDVPISSFVARLLGSQEAPAVCQALQLTELLLDKLPEVFTKYFVKEGVVHALGRLAEQHPAPQPAPAPAPAPAPVAATTDEATGKGSGGSRSRRASSRLRSRSKDKDKRGGADGGGSDADATPAAAAAATATAAAAAAAATQPAAPPLVQAGAATWPAIGAAARALRAAHFGGGGAEAVLDTEGVVQLRELCSRLGKEGEGDGGGAVLQELCSLLEAGGGSRVSTFEFLTSGALSALADHMSGKDLPAGPGRTAAALARLSLLSSRLFARGSGTSPPALPLVRKLQDCLSSLEQLPVSYQPPSASAAGGSLARMPSYAGGGYRGLYGGGGGGSSLYSSSYTNSLTSGLQALSQPLKLRLSRASGAPGQGLRDYSSNVVLIEPLATMAAVEEFLWPKVSAPEAPGAAAAAAAASAEAAEAAAGEARRMGLRNRAAGATAAAASDQPGPPGTRRGKGGASSRGGGPSSALTAALKGKQDESQQQKSGGPTTRSMMRQLLAGRGPHSGGRGRQQQQQEEEEEEQRQPSDEEMHAAAEEAEGMEYMDEGEEEEDGGPHGEGQVVAMAAGGGAGPSGDEDDDDDDDDDDDEGMAGEDEDGAGMAHGGEFSDLEGDMEEDEEEDVYDQEGEMQRHAMRVQRVSLEDEEPPAALPAAAVAGPAANAGARPARHTRGRAPAAATATVLPPPELEQLMAMQQFGSSARQQQQQPQPSAAAASAGPGAPAGRTYAQAAAEEQPGGGPPAPKLQFRLDGQPLPPGSTIFQALQQAQHAAAAARASAAATGDAAGAARPDETRRRVRMMWEDVHTLTYGRYDAEGGRAPQEEGPAAVEQEQQQEEEQSVIALDSASTNPLSEALERRVPDDLPLGGAEGRQALYLLQLLHSLNQHTGQLAAAAAASTGHGRGPGQQQQQPFGYVPAEEFTSAKISSKFAQQQKDVLAVCGGALPRWCTQLLAGGYRFLLPFEMRRQYFYCTAFGIGRALQYLQAAYTQDSGGRPPTDRDGREYRVSRVQRQKVRISRKRILDSAVKVMELYAKSRAVLELEYFGEVGTGLGPTLEFYTLLSHELQRADLRMWRDAAVVPGGGKAAGKAAKQEGKGEKEEKGGAGAEQAAQRSRVGPGREDAAADNGGGSHSGVVGPFVHAPQGLFPSPLAPPKGTAAATAAHARLLGHFKLLGRTVAKALQDNRLLDLPLGPAFFRRALLATTTTGGSPRPPAAPPSSSEVSAAPSAGAGAAAGAGQGSSSGGGVGCVLGLWDVRAVDEGLGATLERLAAASHAHSESGGSGPLLVDGVPLEDLCLTYELPGHPSYRLPGAGPAGEEPPPLTSSNLAAYIADVVDATLGSGVQQQFDAFAAGFSEVFDMRSLRVFAPTELEALLCGTLDPWTAEGLADSIKFDHGYTSHSTPVRFFLELLSEMDPPQQRRFLRFVTGSPRLPPGGVAALQPRLTVVRKHSAAANNNGGGAAAASLGEAGGSMASLASSLAASGPGVGVGGSSAADADLPSVMTCANYIKLPPYSSKEVMRQRLMFAIDEGQGSFDLS